MSRKGSSLSLARSTYMGMVLRIADRFQHVDDGFVGAPWAGPHNVAMPAATAGERIRAGAARQAHGGGAGVLLVIGVQDQHQLQGAHRHGIRHVGLGAHGEHHLQEVLHVAQRVDGVHVGLTDRVLVRVGGDGWHLRDQTHRRELPVDGIVDVERVMVERGQRADDAHEHAHGMGVGAIAIHEIAGSPRAPSCGGA